MSKVKLSPEELELTTRLKQKIIREINTDDILASKSIPVSRYIELALYEPQDGYYNNLLHKFGKDGDFITAPVVSGLFGLCIAKQIQELWQYTIAPRNILEIGAGNGQLMIDLLLAMGDQIECYFVLELSSSLISFQQQRLQMKCPDLYHKVVWLDTLPDEFDGLVLANEVLDAQPTEVLVWENGVVQQRMVTVDKNNDLVYTTQDVASAELLKLANQIKVEPSDYISEINLSNMGFIKSLAEMLQNGFIILIDYGYPAREYYSMARTEGTLRGFFRHSLLNDILVNPGLIDITCSVDFSSIAITAIENKLDFIGYTTQASFLLNCGLLDLIDKKQNKLTDTQYAKLSNQANYLTSPDEMGELFKVIGFSKNIDFGDWMGFSNNDRSGTL